MQSGETKAWVDSTVSALGMVSPLSQGASLVSLINGLPLDGGGANPALIEGDKFIGHVMELGAVDNATDFQAAALRGLLANHGDIANDPRIAPFITDGQLDTSKLANPDMNAQTQVSKWFEDESNRNRYGVDIDRWVSQVNLGKDKGDWSH